MASNGNDSNILDIFTRGSRRSSEAEDGTSSSEHDAPGTEQNAEGTEQATTGVADEKKDRDYRATLPAKSKREVRLRLIYPQPHKVRLLAYSHLNEVLCTGHQWLSLIFTHTVVVLQGCHLDQLLDDLQEERARALVGFQPPHHVEPGPGEPCIRKITDMTLSDFAMQPQEQAGDGAQV